MYKPAIVIPTYKRPNALRRLLKSIEKSYYPNFPIELVISIDRGAEEEVEQIARNFQFSYGNVTLISHDVKQGLKKHILFCGDLSEKFGSVIILEEDLIVDPWFYEYAFKALNFYKNEKKIAGISLYSPEFNEFADLPFEPIRSDKDTYFMQIGSSSGQAWTSEHWKKFKGWYNGKSDNQISKDIRLPDYVRNHWKNNSWKKYYNAWLVDKNFFMVYPYSSYSTNCSDEGGTHLNSTTTLHQVVFLYPDRTTTEIRFSPFNNKAIKYDSFMELNGEIAMRIMKANIPIRSLEVDLYGIKSLEYIQNKEWVVTSKPVDHFKTSYPLAFRPIEMNLSKADDNLTVPFFFLVKSSNISFNNRLSSKKYFSLANYFIRFKPFKSRFFIGIIKGYVRELIRFFYRLF